LRIAFLTSIYPEHASLIYQQYPRLANKHSTEQEEFVRWHALSSYVRWFKFFEDNGFQNCIFNQNLPEVELAWASENMFKPKSNEVVKEIGLEKIKRFEPDIIFTFAPQIYLQDGYLNQLVISLSNKPKLVAWYGANCGNEEIFRNFDLTLSNSKHLVNSLRGKNIQAEFLQHSFDPIILEKIKIPKDRVNRVAFFGNLDVTTNDFRERTKLLEETSSKTRALDVYGNYSKPSLQERSKYSLLQARHKISRSLKKEITNKKIKYWANEENLPPNPWKLNKEFCLKIKQPLFGHQMLERLSNYKIGLNFHNKHTGDYACNMRLFETTGVGCCLLTDDKSDLNELFEKDYEVLSYKTIDEACTILKYLINNKKEAVKIALNGQKKTINKYNSQNAITILVEKIEKLLNK
jgi:spore maturation protein CgeB